MVVPVFRRNTTRKSGKVAKITPYKCSYGVGLRQRGRCSPVHPLQEAGADIQGNLHVHVDAKDPKLLQTIAEVYQWGGLSRLRKPVDDSERVLPQVFDLDEAREGPGWIGEIIHHGTKQKKILSR